METIKVTEKRCSKCGQVKPASEFRRHGRSKDGLWKICRKCQTKANCVNGANPDLAAFTPRELMLELRARGYVGELLYTKKIDIAKL